MSKTGRQLLLVQREEVQTVTVGKILHFLAIVHFMRNTRTPVLYK